jgi:hypothetical protein
MEWIKSLRNLHPREAGVEVIVIIMALQNGTNRTMLNVVQCLMTGH